MTLDEFVKELQEKYKGHFDPLLDYYGENAVGYQVLVESDVYYFSMEVWKNKELSIYLEDKTKQEDILERDLDISEESFSLIRDILKRF